MAEILFKGKKIDELKVVEIKDELGQRGLSKKGVKSVLIKRLEKALMQERLDQVSLKCVPRLYNIKKIIYIYNYVYIYVYIYPFVRLLGII